MPESSPAVVRPITVWIIYLVLFLQGSAVILFTVGEVVASEAAVLGAVGQVVLLILYIFAGVVLILLAFQLFLGRSGARTPTLVLQLCIVVLSFSFFAASLPLIALALLLPAGTVMVLLFLRPTNAWLERA